MTNILSIDSGGALTEVAHASATKALSIASDGSWGEVVASGTLNVLAIDSGGALTEVSVTFGGGLISRQFMLPGYGALNTNATRQHLLGGYGQINEVG